MKKQLFLLLSLMLISVGQVYGQTASASGLLEVHFIDVGQGDSIFIRAPDGHTTLIDGGEGNGLALSYLQQQGVTKLDMVIMSHPHADHIGGLVQVLNAMPIGSFWASGATHTTRVYERLLDTLLTRAIPYYEVQTGGSILAGELTFAVLHGTTRNANLNNTSLVLRLQYGEVAFLFTGDAEKAVEDLLVGTSSTMLPSTVLKVGHHGSHTSSSSAFIQAVHPTVAVYSAGRNNRYGHPHASTIQTLETVGIKVYGTNVAGTIVISTDGTTLQVTTHATGSTAFDVPAVPVLESVAATPISPTLFEYDPFGPDRDCGAFDTHAAAQAFFIAAGGPQSDPHRLDGDNDGIACESLP